MSQFTSMILKNTILDLLELHIMNFRLLDQIKSQPCKTTIGILFAAKSKIIKHWKTLDARITDAANEAKDNVKYLYTLMKFCKPLKRCSPVEMLDCIPGLINAIRMINSISRYYNTSERMTSLFVKVTNQVRHLFLE